VSALIVAAAYLLLATVAFAPGTGRQSWLWLALFSAIFTLGNSTFCRPALVSHAGFFASLTLISAIAAAVLFALDRPIRRIEAARAAEIMALNATTQPEPA
jgi:hypothetical protein